MAKVFTITEGLENMGALRSGGQGSVYKGRRANDVITAVKLLPTPIHSESRDDKNYLDFQNEVTKLKKVNEHPNPNVVKILSHGITDSGSFPFIEMEFIEGPDLAELLQPPKDPVFTIEEVLKVATQLSNALAHCHDAGVRHGDIKSNNVKFNIRTGNYVLLDFGLAAMTDEQRRTSLRHAGAIEFMAPEQNEGLMFFQTDIYSYGVVMFELVAGRVPFPLNYKGETARNHVMLSHMEDPLPDLILLRKQNLPHSGTEELKVHEMLLPQWLIDTITKCLEKKPVNRFANGRELHSHILLHLAKSAAQTPIALSRPVQEKTIVTPGAETPKENILIPPKTSSIHQKNLEAQERLRRENEAVLSSYPKPRRRLSRPALIALAMLLAVVMVAGYTLIGSQNKDEDTYDASMPIEEIPDTSTRVDNNEIVLAQNEPSEKKKADTLQNKKLEKENPVLVAPVTKKAPAAAVSNERREAVERKTEDVKEEDATEEDDTPKSTTKYKVIDVAHFHNEPDESTRRAAFINHWNNAILTPQKERNGFIYIVYTNDEGQTSRGWLNKKDLKAFRK